jgi:hypothetical protein
MARALEKVARLDRAGSGQAPRDRDARLVRAIRHLGRGHIVYWPGRMIERAQDLSSIA